MSSETSAWAKEQSCGDPVTKAVLMEIANWAKPTGICEFLAVKRIAEVVEVSPRTVQRHIARLEDPDPTAGGLGLIRRVERHRDDGGRGANSFELVGYQPPLSARTRPRASLSPPHDKMTRGGDAAVTAPRDNCVMGYGNKNIPPSSPSGDDTPAPDFFDRGRKGDDPDKPASGKAHRLPDDWNAPPASDLPPMAHGLVRQWPAGAYEATCEAFRLHWRTETRAIGRKSDWTAALAKWCINDHPSIMRAAKAGVSFAAAAPLKPSGPPAPPPKPVAAKSREDERSARLHAMLKRELGDALYSAWIKLAALIFDPPGLVAVFPSDFARGWAEDRFQSKIRALADQVQGAPLRWVRFETEQRPVAA